MRHSSLRTRICGSPEACPAPSSMTLYSVLFTSFVMSISTIGDHIDYMEMTLPTIIQGGMGFGVSDWRLARAVSELGQLGVVSGTALDCVVARKLQAGDPGGHIRRALEHFPIPSIAKRVMEGFSCSGRT